MTSELPRPPGGEAEPARARIRDLLAAHQLKPKKIFGQNFMVDTNFATAIAREAAPGEKTLVLEVGPGTGALTQQLLHAHPHARVLAIEIDTHLAQLLRETFAAEIASGRLTLLEGDVLAGKHALNREWVRTALEIADKENRPRRVLCANLPYNAATPLLANLALDPHGLNVSVAIGTVQLELAERLLGRPGSSDYGALAALMALRATGKIVRRVGNAVFWPRPAVESAVVRIEFLPWEPREPGALQRGEAEAFQVFLSRVFSQRRKMLRAVLKNQTFPDDVPPQSRAEDLPPQTLLKLFRDSAYARPSDIQNGSE